MNHILDDKEYYDIVSDIINNDEFDKIKKIEHHGITRYEHSLKVSYRSVMGVEIPCVLIDKEEKKPKKFDYSKYKLVPNKGLYHFFCHCEEKAINVPKLTDINVLEVRSKFNDFFKRKKGIFYGIGYTYKLLLPYTIGIFAFWIVLLLCWYIINLPIGIGVYPIL